MFRRSQCLAANVVQNECHSRTMRIELLSWLVNWLFRLERRVHLNSQNPLNGLFNLTSQRTPLTQFRRVQFPFRLARACKEKPLTSRFFNSLTSLGIIIAWLLCKYALNEIASGIDFLCDYQCNSTTLTVRRWPTFRSDRMWFDDMFRSISEHTRVRHVCEAI